MTRENEIFKQIEQGNMEGLDELVGMYYPEIYRYCCWHTSNQANAEDAVQETFLKAVRYMDRYAHRGRFRAFLYRIAGRGVGGSAFGGSLLPGDRGRYGLFEACQAASRRNVGTGLSALWTGDETAGNCGDYRAASQNGTVKASLCTEKAEKDGCCRAGQRGNIAKYAGMAG